MDPILFERIGIGTVCLLLRVAVLLLTLDGAEGLVTLAQPVTIPITVVMSTDRTLLGQFLRLDVAFGCAARALGHCALLDCDPF
jgi:hypothetical protein